MSSIACNPESQAEGTGSNPLGGAHDMFYDHVTQALALQLNLKTTQQANEKALSTLTKAKGSLPVSNRLYRHGQLYMVNSWIPHSLSRTLTLVPRLAT